MRRNGLMIFILLFSFVLQLEAQTTYDQQMEKLANSIAQRVKQKEKLNVAVWFFHSTKGEKNSLGDYIGRDFSIHFVNVDREFKVVDRDHIEQITNEHNLNANGFINPQTAKKVGMLTAADAIVTGTVDYGLHSLRIRLKIIDTETGEQIAATVGNVTPDENLKFILSDYFEKNNKNIDRNKKRVQTPETYENPRSTNPECEKKKVGDYCFVNNDDKTYLIDVFNNGVGSKKRYSISVKPNSKGCFFDLPAASYQFALYTDNLRTVSIGSFSTRKGAFRIQTCKAISYTIEKTKKKNNVNDFYKTVRKKN